MWKLVIADDERLIVKGLKKLIDWKALDVEIVGEANDGHQLKACISHVAPDLILTDITMPGCSGLDVLNWYNEQNGKGKFIFVSGYQKFSYAQEALKAGAVDYLLKPVGHKDLEKAVKKAIQMLEEQNTVEIFKTEKDEFQKLFEDINNGHDYENEDLYRLFQEENLDIRDCFYVGISAGICPDEAASLNEKSFGQFNLTRFSVFNRLTEAFGSRKLGFAVKKEEDALHIMGVFPNRERDVFIEKYVEPFRTMVEEACGVPLCVGIGTVAEEPSGMLQTYKEGRLAFGLYAFEEQSLIDFSQVHREYHVSFDDFQEDVDQVFRAIIAKDDSFLDKVDKVMDDVEAMHYGNWNAIMMRTMDFTGDLGSRLYQYRLLHMDFYEMQDELQQRVEAQHTMAALKTCIHNYYEELIDQVYAKGKTKDKIFIENVKAYIREHYAEDLSIKELAEVACVSPNYFSAMFKKEIGQNYKAYLTAIRMEEALRLLRETDYKTYEIGEKVGYNNARRFVDAFKQVYSVSPMEYKKGLKK